ncbi:hypothetical protein AWH69_01585 [Janibacter melonis]|uniref:Glycosyltransferase 2-like domain-containing protein n=1 Tax=Janibacter melonis TaxID=262209 RepID=A0A176QFP2_9MICO|nr:glycosyltransferase [Janibacter melonis]MBD5831678.1 glycosyltransferase [Janibacter melonis]OAB88524.1 hypothetical protein AWH69_01585 [Janibacter melonis]
MSTPGTGGEPSAVASLLVPAHDEGRVLPRLLTSVARAARTTTVEVVVAANGCSDDTVDGARRSGLAHRVLDLPEPSKHGAVLAADDIASHHPRIICDADLELGEGMIDALVAPILAGEVLATAPRRVLETTGCSRVVRAYYRVWQELPSVRSGLFGRGVIALGPEGMRRFRAMEAMLSDDLALSEAFTEDERRVVSAEVVVRVPRTTGDLLRRRTRVVEGNAEADERGLRGDAARTSPADLVRIARADLHRVPDVAVFVAVTLAARLLARRRARTGHDHWLRDESSRQG